MNVSLDFKIGAGFTGSIGEKGSEVGIEADVKLVNIELFDTQGSLVEGEDSFETDFATKDGE